LKPACIPKGGARPPLAGEAVADRDRERIAGDLQPKLAAVACGFPGRHQARATNRAATTEEPGIAAEGIPEL